MRFLLLIILISSCEGNAGKPAFTRHETLEAVCYIYHNGYAGGMSCFQKEEGINER